MNNKSNTAQLIVVALFSSLAGGLIAGGVATTFAQVTPAGGPVMIPYQGRLESAGHPVDFDGMKMRFTLHNRDNGQAWTSPITDVNVRDGYFSTMISNFPADYMRANELTVSVELEDPNTATWITLGGEQRIMPSFQAYNAAPSQTFNAPSLSAETITSDSAGQRTEIKGAEVKTNKLTFDQFPPGSTVNATIRTEALDGNNGWIRYGLDTNNATEIGPGYRHSFHVGNGNAPGIYDNTRFEVHKNGTTTTGDLSIHKLSNNPGIGGTIFAERDLRAEGNAVIAGNTKTDTLTWESFPVTHYSANAAAHPGRIHTVDMINVANGICFLTYFYLDLDDDHVTRSRCEIKRVNGVYQLEAQDHRDSNQVNCNASCLRLR